MDPNSLYSRQNRYHDALSRYVNGGVSLGQRFFRFVRPGVSDRFQAEWLADEYGKLTTAAAAEQSSHDVIEIQPYAGRNPAVLRLRKLLDATESDEIIGAYVHGSVGSYEEIGYSDLDMLVILGDAVMTDQRRLRSLAGRLNRWRRALYAQDLLQHHGWFVLTAFDLNHYCEAYFPTTLFSHAKSLYEGLGCTLKVRPRPSAPELISAFDRMADSVQRQLESRRYPKNMYVLKSLLSRVMLLPALYVQARDGKGLWKADAFDAARKDFEPELWSPMDRVSRVRSEWSYYPSPVTRFMMKGTGLPSAVCRKYFGTPIPPHIGRICDTPLYEAVIDLVIVMRRTLNAGRTSVTDRTPVTTYTESAV